MTSPIRVLLVDDHTLFRSGVRALLARQAEIDVVGEAENGPEGVKLAASLNPDVVLLDLNMPGLSGVETLQLLLQDAPQRAVVMLTVSEDADDLARALRVGLEAPMQLTAAFLGATDAWTVPRKVLNISSGLGRRAMASQAAYCAAKAGMDHFTRCVALDEAL